MRNVQIFVVLFMTIFIVSAQGQIAAVPGRNALFRRVSGRLNRVLEHLSHYHVHDVYEKEYGEQESNWHGQPESLSHPGEANFQAPPKIVPPGTKDFSLSLRIIPNVLNLSHYEMPFMDTRGHILWRGT
ncbi:hypothetical protein F2Q68_00013415 [Brassica cretica]|uniref:Uncharacterized protein n=1 Tax=Brassica cretica TaxID=69181 RepID=A0A8S9HHC2_BRACR|nr:hypothetical protein F2Q68_00013415 [Brassica cretica]